MDTIYNETVIRFNFGNYFSHEELYNSLDSSNSGIL